MWSHKIGAGLLDSFF
uniref:Uncharacterized protein n=1 Tax=Lepeophtheirus salmonis TaxID=72036 RepID=A0A0K2T8H3_LEPSM